MEETKCADKQIRTENSRGMGTLLPLCCEQDIAFQNCLTFCNGPVTPSDTKKSFGCGLIDGSTIKKMNKLEIPYV
jgi:hypothetical protein